MLLAALPLAAGDGIPFWLPCGWQSAALSTLLAALLVDAGGMVSLLFALWMAVCRPKYFAGRGSAGDCYPFLFALWSAICRSKDFAAPEAVNSQRDDTRPVAPQCQFLNRKNSLPLQTNARNKSARPGESPRSTHKQ